jgi:phospholipid transport system substrate-binding protein
MKLRMLSGLLTLALLAGAGARAAEDNTAPKDASATQKTTAATDLGPRELIETSAQKMLDALEANRADYRKNPKKVEQLVDEVLLPHFDTQYSARLVLGKHWRTATAEQRQKFVDAFYHSLLENYGAALVEFTADKMVVLPFKGDEQADRATVRTEVKRSDGTRVPVNYSMRKTPQGWKAWDVTIEGISYVKNFRDDFGAEIDQKGLDAVIRRLETEGVKPAKKSA